MEHLFTPFPDAESNPIRKRLNEHGDILDVIVKILLIQSGKERVFTSLDEVITTLRVIEEEMKPKPVPAEWSNNVPTPQSEWRPVRDGSQYWMPPSGYRKDGVAISGIVPVSEVPKDVLDNFISNKSKE